MVERADDPTSWKKLWDMERTPWDKGDAPPATIELLRSGKIPAGNGRVLVPGCGRGYDAFAAAQYLPGVKEVVGLDAVKLANEEAKRLQAERNVSQDILKFEIGDFFNLKPEKLFDVVIDHTFLCAIPLSLRKPWAQAMADLIVPGGTLITYMFPLGTFTDGPPHALSLEVYDELLLPNFDQIHLVEVATKFHINRETTSEKIGVWRRKQQE
ncbi:hypothetical protein HDU87_003758 [Geranomyces variabilis]|uniref:S-adenosyl-L-methionine-dependent methyltransferase n=1 Tax=Geranomyces variabilis TaxID=109894 RepID=A0AAD5TJJ8_9FUNG|nr:hypothetical protein HDU87_003758 [Geranomyces variabilis]